MTKFRIIIAPVRGPYVKWITNCWFTSDKKDTTYMHRQKILFLCSWGLNMAHTGVSLHGWLGLRHINTVWRWLTPMRPPPLPQRTRRHTSGHHPSALIHPVPLGTGLIWGRLLGFVCKCMLLPCVGSWLSQKCLSRSLKLMSLGEKTTLTTSVWPVIPEGESQSCSHSNQVEWHFRSLLRIFFILLFPLKYWKANEKKTKQNHDVYMSCLPVENSKGEIMNSIRVCVIECMCHGERTLRLNPHRAMLLLMAQWERRREWQREKDR